MNNWTWAYIAATSAVFGYSQNNAAAGIFMFLFLLLLTRLLYVIAGVNTRIETLLNQRLEDPTGGCERKIKRWNRRHREFAESL